MKKVETAKTVKKLPPIMAPKIIQAKIIPKQEKNFSEKLKVSESSNFNENLFAFVSKGEGSFQSKAFCDSYYSDEEKIKYGITYPGLIRKSPEHCTKWTIGFGTDSYRGEVIAYDEGVKRRNEAILARSNSITSTCLTENQKIAAVDFIYQYSSKYANQMRYYANNCQINNAFNYIVNHRDFYKKKKQTGLVKREQLRINKFYE